MPDDRGREAAVSRRAGPVHVERVEVETTDLAYAHELICRQYVEYEMQLRWAPDDYVFRSRSAAANGLQIAHMHHRARTEVTTDPYPFLMTLTLVGGRFSLGDRHFATGDTAMFPIGVPVPVYSDRVDTHAVRFPLAAATRAARRLGVDPAAFRFNGPAPVSAERRTYWASTVAYLHHAFAGPDPAVTHPLLLAAVVETIAAAAITVFPNTTMTLGYTAGPGDAAPSAVRRAVEYIDEHAGEPIAVEDIAAAAGVGVRALRAAFARHRDLGPAAYLRRVRLERAHRDLLAADPARGDTVASIARRWGFPSAGRFAADYRRVYARPPGRTLRG